jgi:hypothetical protein
MDSDEQLLNIKMRNALQVGGYCVSGGRGLFMEVMEKETRRVWMSAKPVTLETYETLALDESLLKVGIALAPMDQAAFQYSPDTPGQPVLERVINQRLYINVATPAPPHEWIVSTERGGPVEFTVNKAHVVGFKAQRSVAVMSLPDGDYVEVVGDSEGDEALVLPAGARLTKLVLQEPWLVQLPSPTRVFFWFGDSMRSFQGPVLLP